MVSRLPLIIAILAVVAACGAGAAPAAGGAPIVVTAASAAQDGASVDLEAEVRCRAGRQFGFTAFVLDPKHSTLAWSGYPTPTSRPGSWTCRSKPSTLELVATQGGSSSKLRFNGGDVRVCITFRTWTRRGAAAMDASCQTISLS